MKQRLVGAVVLISLAVIFIPIILEGPDDEWSPHTQGMPEAPQIDYGDEVELSLPVEAPETASSAMELDTLPVAATVMPAPAEPVTGAPAPAADATPPVTARVPEPAAKPKPGPAAQPPVGDWVIQVGSFSQKLNAQGLRDRLKKAGYAAFLQDARTDAGQSWRVLVGPLKTRSDAEKVRDELASKRHIKGIVIQNKG